MKIAQIKSTRVTVLCSALLLLLCACPVHALSLEALLASAAEEDVAYAAGTRAMNDQHWSDAVSDFDKVIGAKNRRSDAALYWKAYSLNKLGNNPLALATCYQLRSGFADGALLCIQEQSVS